MLKKQCSLPGDSKENKLMSVEDEYAPDRHSHTMGIISEQNYEIALCDGSQITKVAELRDPIGDYYQT